MTGYSRRVIASNPRTGNIDMSHLILGTLNDEDAGMLLLSRLEKLEQKQGPFEEVGIATLNAGRIRHDKQQKNWRKELENQPLLGPMGIAYARSKASQDETTPYVWGRIVRQSRISLGLPRPFG